MLDHQEIELKWALTAQAHDRLLPKLIAKIGPAAVLQQENRFFDTPDRRLRAARMNLRLRRENHRLVLTCKHKAGSAGPILTNGLSEHREWECELDPSLTWPAATHQARDPAAAWTLALPLPAPVREALDGQPLEALGGFANCRHEFHLERAGFSELLCLDCTDFGVRTDYELEIETTDPEATSRYWQAQLATWNISWENQTLTKFARFLALTSKAR